MRSVFGELAVAAVSAINTRSKSVHLLITQPLSNTAIFGEYSNDVQLALQQRIKQHVAPHPKAQWALPIKRAIHIEHD